MVGYKKGGEHWLNGLTPLLAHLLQHIRAEAEKEQEWEEEIEWLPYLAPVSIQAIWKERKTNYRMPSPSRTSLAHMLLISSSSHVETAAAAKVSGALS